MPVTVALAVTLVVAASTALAAPREEGPKPPGPPPISEAAPHTAALPGYQIVTGEWSTIDPRTARLVNATCPAGTQILGGGAYNDGPGDVILRKSAPMASSTGNRWIAEAANTGDSPRGFRAYAICAGGLTSHRISMSAGQWPAASGPHQQAWTRAECQPNDMDLAPAGFETEAFSTADVGTIRTDGRDHPTRAVAQVIGENTGAAPVTVKAYAVCVQGIAGRRLAGSTPEPMAPNGGYASATAECPAGTTVLSGGGGGGEGTTLTDSFPVSTTQWRVYVRNNRNYQVHAVAQVLCGP